MKHKKKLLAVIVLAVIATWSVVFYSKKQIKANHDYVCGYSAIACNDTCTWTAWNTDTNSRLCRGRQALVTKWGNTRVGCSYQNHTFGNYGGYRGGMQLTDLTINSSGVRYYNNEKVPDPSKPMVTVQECEETAKGLRNCKTVRVHDTSTLNGYYYLRNNGECAGVKGQPLSAPPMSCYVEIVPEEDCVVRRETDTVEPKCNFQTVNGGTQLQFMCTKGDGGTANCVNYTSWTNVDFALPNEAKIIGIATESGIYKGCVVPPAE